METLLSWFHLVISNFTCLNANIRAHVCSLHCILSVVSICYYIYCFLIIGFFEKLYVDASNYNLSHWHYSAPPLFCEGFP